MSDAKEGTADANVAAPVSLLPGVGAARPAEPAKAPDSTAIASGTLSKGSEPSPAAAEKPLTPNFVTAVEEVKTAYRTFRKSALTLAIALAKLKAVCKEEGLPFLEVCAQHLAELGLDGMTESWISKLCAVGEYMVAKKLGVAADTSTQPSYSQIYPLARFLVKKEYAEKKRKEWDALHAEVFDPNATKRPSTTQVAERVAEILAPPPSSTGTTPQSLPGLIPEEVTAENFQDWFSKNSADGKLLIHPVRVSRQSADALAMAIKSQWKTLKEAEFIRIEVTKQ